MNVDQAGLHHAAGRVGAQNRVHRRKRVGIGLFHEHLPQGLRHQHPPPARIGEHMRAMAGRSGFGNVQRPNNARFLRAVFAHGALVESVVTQCQAIRAGGKQRLGVLGRQARAARRILAIDHHEIERPCRAQHRQPAGECSAARPAHHIAKKKQFHGARLRADSRAGQERSRMALPSARKARQPLRVLACLLLGKDL